MSPRSQRDRGLTQGDARRGDLVLAIDQGTTSTKALLVDAGSGRVVSTASAPVGIAFPQPGWVEQDPADVWASVEAAVGECLNEVTTPRIAGVAISNQRESVLAWRASTGEPVGPILGWQDSRTAAWCVERAENAALVRERTGLQLDAMFSAPKMRWLLEQAAAQAIDLGDVRVGTIDTWLVSRLTGEHVAEAGNASRTMLLDTERVRWDDELLSLFGIPRHVLPRVVASSGPFGTVRGGALGLDGVPVAAVLADSHAALFHHGRGMLGVGKATYGTGSSVMLPTASRTLAATLAWSDAGAAQYASEGNILTAGAGLDWVARILGGPAGVPGGAFLTDLAATEPDSAGVTFVPAFTGLGAPHWDRNAVASLVGVTGGTTRGHIARAAIDAVAHQVADVLDAVLAEDAAPFERLVADGGATASGLLMQTQADLLGRPVVVSASPHASALGAADLAIHALTGTLPPATCSRATYTPGIDDDARSSRRRAWQLAVRRSRGIAVDGT